MCLLAGGIKPSNSTKSRNITATMRPSAESPTKLLVKQGHMKITNATDHAT